MQNDSQREVSYLDNFVYKVYAFVFFHSNITWRISVKKQKNTTPMQVSLIKQGMRNSWTLVLEIAWMLHLHLVGSAVYGVSFCPLLNRRPLPICPWPCALYTLFFYSSRFHPVPTMNCVFLQSFSDLKSYLLMSGCYFLFENCNPLHNQQRKLPSPIRALL